jgi:hypothetical protein
MATKGDPNIGVWVGSAARQRSRPLLAGAVVHCSPWQLGDNIGRAFATRNRYERVGTIRVNLQEQNIEDFQHWQIFRTPQSEQQTAATLVVCPHPLVHQWKDQINKHTREKQRVVIYNNIQGGGQQAASRQRCPAGGRERLSAESIAAKFMEAHWVIITYDELAKLKAQDVPVCIEWWRVVIDEAQTMQDARLLRSALATKLQAMNRVVLSGTPITIGTSVDDLSPLFKFFGVQPYCDKWFWDEGVKAKVQDATPAETTRLMTRIGQLMTRTLKTDFSPDDLKEMMNVQNEEKIAVRFSPVETCMYSSELQLLKERKTTVDGLRRCCAYLMHCGAADSLAEMCEQQHAIAMFKFKTFEHKLLECLNKLADLRSLLTEQHAAREAYEAVLSFEVSQPDVDFYYQKSHAAACIDDANGDNDHWTDAMVKPTLDFANAAVDDARKAVTQVTICWDSIQHWSKSSSHADFKSLQREVENAGFALVYVLNDTEGSTAVDGNDHATAEPDSWLPKGQSGQTLPPIGASVEVEISMDALRQEIEEKLQRFTAKKRKTKRDREVQQSIQKQLQELGGLSTHHSGGKLFTSSVGKVIRHVSKTKFIAHLERRPHHLKEVSNEMELTLEGPRRFRGHSPGICNKKPNLLAQLRQESQFHDGSFGALDTDVTNTAQLVERLQLFFHECEYCQQQARKELEQLRQQVLAPPLGAKFQTEIEKLAKDVFDANMSTSFQPDIWGDYAERVLEFGQCIFRIDDIYVDNSEQGGTNSGHWRSKGKPVCEFKTQMEAVFDWIAAQSHAPMAVKKAALEVSLAIEQWKKEFVAQRAAVIQIVQHLHRLHMSARATTKPTMEHRHLQMIKIRAHKAQSADNNFLRYDGQAVSAVAPAAQTTTVQGGAAAAAASAAAAAPTTTLLRGHQVAWQYEVDNSDGQGGIERQLRARIADVQVSHDKSWNDRKTAWTLAQRLRELQQPVECTLCRERICDGTSASSLRGAAKRRMTTCISSVWNILL